MTFSTSRAARMVSLGLAAALLTAGPARADGTTSGHIANLYSFGGHSGTLIILTEGMPNPDGCPLTSWYIFPDTSPRAAFVQSMLLTQLKSGGVVNLTLSGCYEGYPMIRNVSITS